MRSPTRDDQAMKEALRMARRSAARGEVPVGAVVLHRGNVIARGGNATRRRGDPTAHAEVVVLRKAARVLNNHRLAGCTLYVTLEPCLMCLGAMVQARIDRCVFGARDPKVGASRIFQRATVQRGLNHRFLLEGDLLAEEAAQLLRAFFRARRSQA